VASPLAIRSNFLKNSGVNQHPLGMKTSAILSFLVWLAGTNGLSARASTVLVEAESFSEPGGWVVDPQFMDQMVRRTCWRMDWAVR